MRKLALLLSALTLAAVGLAACGGDDETTSAADATAATETTGGDTGGGATISISADADGALAYTETELTAAAGNDTIEFDNPAGLEHDVVIEDDGGNEVARTDLVSGGSTSATAELEPGTYTYYCSVPGHREGGMEGTLTVN